MKSASPGKSDAKASAGQAHRDRQGRNTIIDGAGEPRRSKVGQVDPQADRRGESDYDKEKLQERVAKLAGGVALIKVGAATKSRMKEKKARSRMHCTRPVPRWKKASSQEGRSADPCPQFRSPSLKGDNHDQDAGIKIVMPPGRALRWIVASRRRASVVLNKVVEEGQLRLQRGDGEYGNVRTRKARRRRWHDPAQRLFQGASRS